MFKLFRTRSNFRSYIHKAVNTTGSEHRKIQHKTMVSLMRRYCLIERNDSNCSTEIETLYKMKHGKVKNHKDIYWDDAVALLKDGGKITDNYLSNTLYTITKTRSLSEIFHVNREILWLEYLVEELEK